MRKSELEVAGYKGKQGRKPKASTIVEREGQKEETQPKTSRLPAAPRYLTRVAKIEWRRIGRLLQDARLLTNLDTAALAFYCTAYARYVEAEVMLQGPAGYCPNCDPHLEDAGQKENSPVRNCRGSYHLAVEYGMIIKDRMGRKGPSPYIIIGDKAMAQMIRILGEFGMTPASRSRIPNKPESQSPRHPKPLPVQPAGTLPDPREALQMAIQASKN